MLTGGQQGNDCLIEPAGNWFSEPDVICFPFSLQIANPLGEGKSFREKFLGLGVLCFFFFFVLVGLIGFGRGRFHLYMCSV